MNAAHVLQTVLSVIPDAQPERGEQAATAACAASTPGTSQLPVLQAAGTPIALPQMIMAVFSMAAFWDWAKLLLIGAFLETCRRGWTEAWTSLIGQAWVTMGFQCDGDGSGELSLHIRVPKRTMLMSFAVLSRYRVADVLAIAEEGFSEGPQHRGLLPVFWHQGREHG